MGVTSHQLQLFFTVAEKGSFSAAAKALHMTQPAVTMQVQALEEYFSTRLFIRSNKRIELTESGKVLLPFAEHILSITREAVEAMTTHAEKVKGRLLIGASLTIGEHILPQWLGTFSIQHPDTAIHLSVLNTSQLIQAIAEHSLQLALVEAPVNHPGIRSEPVMEDELMLVLPNSHPLLSLSEIHISDLKPYSLILRESGSGTRQVLEATLEEQGVHLNDFHVPMELGSTGAIKYAVESNIGISFLSRYSVRHEIEAGTICLRRVKNFSFKRHFFAITSPSAPVHLPALSFLTFLRTRGA